MSDTCSSDAHHKEPNSSVSRDSSTADSQPDATAVPADFDKALEYLAMLGVGAEDGKRALEATASPQASDAARSGRVFKS